MFFRGMGLQSQQTAVGWWWMREAACAAVGSRSTGAVAGGDLSIMIHSRSVVRYVK